MHKDNLASIITWIAGGAAVIIAIAFPLGYFTLAHDGLVAQMETEANLRAGMISNFVVSNQELWTYESHHLEQLVTLLTGRSTLSPGQSNRIVYSYEEIGDTAGNKADWLTITRTANLLDGEEVVGYFEVKRSIRGLLVNTLFAGLFGLLLSIGVFVALRVLPLSALRKTTLALKEEIEKHDQARLAAETANRAKSQFLAAASHDLRQPLHALGMFAASLSERVHHPEVRTTIDNINASVLALEDLFNELLDISRLDAGTIQPKLRSFLIGPLFDRLYAEYASEAAEHGLVFSVVHSDFQIYSDPTLLERVLRNLISNAIRYTPNGEVVVECKAGESMIVLEVRDTGVGIPLDQQESIFEEFYQIGNPERDRKKGLGLGLAIVKRTAQLLGCSVHLSSSPGQGSTFSLEIPQGQTPSLEAEHIDEEMKPRSVLNGQFIVVIDDELAVLKSTEILLTQWGCHVLTASSFDEAAAYLSEYERLPDVIISDYRLRGSTIGSDVIRRLQAELGCHIPGVIITGDIAPDRLKEAEASGYHLLYKPVAPEKLRALLSSLTSAFPANSSPACEQ